MTCPARPTDRDAATSTSLAFARGRGCSRWELARHRDRVLDGCPEQVAECVEGDGRRLGASGPVGGARLERVAAGAGWSPWVFPANPGVGQVGPLQPGRPPGGAAVGADVDALDRRETRPRPAGQNLPLVGQRGTERALERA